MANNPFFTSKGTEDFGGIRTPTRYILDTPDPDSPEAQQLVAQNKDIINQFVESQRQAYALSVIGIQRGYIVTPDIAIRYMNIQGQETVLLSPYPQVSSTTTEVPETSSSSNSLSLPPIPLPPIPPQEVLYMMVLYNDPAADMPNQAIAAISMNELSAASPYWTGVSEGSSWGNNRIPVAQYDFGAGGVFLTPIDFTPMSSLAHTYFLWTTNIVPNVPTDGIPTSTSYYLFDQSKDVYGNSQTSWVYPPVMNGTKTTIYTAFDVFSYDKGKLNRTGDGADPNVSPYFISPDGDYYYSPVWYNTQYINATDYTHTPTNTYETGSSSVEMPVIDLSGTGFGSGFGNGVLPPASCSIIATNAKTADTAPPGDPAGDGFSSYQIPTGTGFFYYGYCALGQTASAVTGYSYTYYLADDEHPYAEDVINEKTEYSGTFPYPQYNPSAGNGPVLSSNMVPVTASALFEYVDLGFPTYGDPTYWQWNVEIFNKTYSFAGIILFPDAADVPEPSPAIQLQPFPPSLPGKYYFTSIDQRWNDSEFSTPLPITAPIVHTPYGDFDVALSTSDELGMFTAFRPWLHVSNSSDYIQGFEISGTPYLYLNGEDYLNVLAKGLSTSSHTVRPEDIRALFFDIELATIQSITAVTANVSTIGY